MRDVIKIVIIVLTLSFLLATGPAFAFMPSDRGVSAPQTVWSDLGVRGTVSGKVVTSLDQTKGLDGAYVALVDAMTTGREYYNTTTDADGNFRFTGVNATYSSNLFKGPDGTDGSYQLGTSAYMIYANISTGEGYSGTFGVDANHTNYVIDTIVIYAGIPDREDIVTPEPTSTVEPTAVAVTPGPEQVTPTPPDATQSPAVQGSLGMLVIAAAAVIIVLAIAAIAVYFLFLRKK